MAMMENKLAYDLALRYAQTMLEAELRAGNLQVPDHVPDGWREMDRLEALFKEAYDHYAYCIEVKLPEYPEGFKPGSIN